MPFKIRIRREKRSWHAIKRGEGNMRIRLSFHMKGLGGNNIASY